ncbi:hypothetical protein GW17_00026392 [Ensete ventricosum]|nr:hypothetical protein GW17_00026392 [Ensete ventricosum]
MEKCPRQADELKITSNAGDAEYPDHDDALVVTVYIADARVRRVVVDTRSSVNIITGESPYSLVLDTDAVLPPEVVFLTLWVENYEEGTSEEGLRANLDQI